MNSASTWLTIREWQNAPHMASRGTKSLLTGVHAGKAALFADGKLQGVFDDAGGATHAAIKRYKPGQFLIRVVGDDSMPAKFFLRVG